MSRGLARRRPGRKERGGRGGFTLIELMAVIAIIGMLISLMLAGLHAAKMARDKTATRYTMDNMSIGITTMKQDLELPNFLAVDADGFALPVDAEGWHVWIDGDGVQQRFEIGRELDPGNPAWADDFAPYLNRLEKRYFNATKRQIRKKNLTDAWGTPFRYEIYEDPSMDAKVEAERLVSAGLDFEFGTADDIVHVLGSRRKP